MRDHLVYLRQSAYLAQSGRCFYCGLPMWVRDPESFAVSHGITPSQARVFQCTAEHLEARKDGGQDTKRNIVAACFCCNQRRHKRKQAPDPDDYRLLVQQRLAKGRWHPQSVANLLVPDHVQGARALPQQASRSAAVK